MRRSSSIYFLLLLACGKQPGERAPSPLLSSAAQETVVIDVARAARDPEELLRAALAPHRAAAGLGAHRFTGSSKILVTEAGQPVEQLDEQALIEVAADGAFHARYQNSQDYGREIVFAGGTLWIRPGYGKFHRRAPTSPDEPARYADETYATLGAQLELCANALAVADGGETTAAGRPARRITLSAGPARQRPAQTLPQRAWRDGVTVLECDGELTLDSATGVVLAGRVHARLSFVREGRSFEMTLEASHAITDLGGAVAVTPPPAAEFVDTPERSHEFEDREQLLKGIAPPGRRASTPAEPGPK